MSVTYKGPTPDRNYSLKDFLNNGVIVTMLKRFIPYSKNYSAIRCVFRSNGLMGEIRTTCYGNTYAVDVEWEWGESKCLTTECKTVREAKNILFKWFKSKGFKYTNKEMNSNWRKAHLRLSDLQLKLKI